MRQLLSLNSRTRNVNDSGRTPADSCHYPVVKRGGRVLLQENDDPVFILGKHLVAREDARAAGNAFVVVNSYVHFWISFGLSMCRSTLLCQEYGVEEGGGEAGVADSSAACKSAIAAL